jgi:glycine dehydrogenase subunit 1
MFIPHTNPEREAMLKAIGIKHTDDLFQDVPEAFRFPKLTLPPALTEMEVVSLLQEIADANENAHDLVCFLGAGAYHHFVPSVIDNFLQRGDFLTAYTPYQPEVSQGTLQAIFEYQSLIAALTGMDVSNASHYDGATATAEAGVLAYHHFRGKRTKIIVSPTVHPEFRSVLRTYMSGMKDISVVGDDETTDPFSDPENLLELVDLETSLVVVQYPDFLGRIYDYSKFAAKIHESGALLCVVVNPTALGILKTPGELGADIVVGEGQPLGIPLAYGGPYLGIFATKKELSRKISGRLVGETIDQENRRGYVLTLTAREQHIRREKATSNICTNQGLLALAAAMYMSLLGKQGLKKVADLCYQKAHYAADQIANLPGYQVFSETPFFHEFVVLCPHTVEVVNQRLLDHGILGGFDLGTVYPSLKKHMLIAVTEMISRDEIDHLVEALAEVAHA